VPRNHTPTPAAYLARQPADRRAELSKVRRVIRANLPKGYREGTNWGVISYEVPLEKYRDTYNGHPLCYVALAAQKNYLTLHLMTVYGDAGLARKLRDGFKSAGKKLDMGKACIRFQRADDLALDVIGEIVAAVPMEKYVAIAKSVKRR
jgi:hypothetical protein